MATFSVHASHVKPVIKLDDTCDQRAWQCENWQKSEVNEGDFDGQSYCVVYRIIFTL